RRYLQLCNAPGNTGGDLPAYAEHAGCASASCGGGDAMLAYLRVPWAFLVRDFREDSSYKIGFLFRVASAMINVAIYYFIASAFGSAAAPYLSGYGGNYFAFVLIGVAFSEYLAIGIGARGDTLGWALRVSSLVLGGVYYPVNVLPSWLNLIGQLLPLTHALELLRRSLLRGEGFAQLGGELAILAGLTLLLLPLGLLACQLAIRVARTDGSSSHY